MFCRELIKFEKKIDDFENCFKRNNIVIWGLWEDVEKEYDFLEFFLVYNFFGNYMGIEDIEVMRVYCMNIKEWVVVVVKLWLIYVYFFRYMDKVKILKVVVKVFKDKVFFEF